MLDLEKDKGILDRKNALIHVVTNLSSTDARLGKRQRVLRENECLDLHNYELVDRICYMSEGKRGMGEKERARTKQTF